MRQVQTMKTRTLTFTQTTIAQWTEQFERATHSILTFVLSLSLSFSLSLSWSFSPLVLLSLSRFVFFCISPKGSKGYGRRSICVVLVLIYASKRCKRGMRPFSSMLLAHRKRLCDTVLKLRGGRYKMIQPMMFQDWSPLDENQYTQDHILVGRESSEYPSPGCAPSGTPRCLLSAEVVFES